MRATRSSGRRHARLLEQAEVVVVGAAGNLHEGRVRIPPLHLEAQHVAVEPHAPVDVRDPQDEVLEPLETDPVAATW